MKLKKSLLFFLFFCLVLTRAYTQVDSTKIVKDTLQVDKEMPLSQRSYTNDFKDKYNTEAYHYETASNPNGWFSRFKAWLVRLVARIFAIENQVQAGKITSLISYILYFLVILAVIYFIIKAVLNKEGRWVFGKYSDKKTVHFEDVESNIHQVDFKSLIADATANKNYRLAIRYYYLWLLKELSENGLIEYDVEKTNDDYFNELKNDTLKSKFSYASYLYNYIWYGAFTIQDKQYTIASHRLENLIKSIKK